MAFKPIAGQEYYLISKHSGKALGFDNDAKAAQLKQFDFDAANRHQKFRFDAGKDFHWILSPPFKSYYLAVHDSWQTDNAPVIQWLWAPDQANNRFRFEAAGDGYYRIRIMHSNKFLHAASKDNKAAVVQYGLADGDNQLFKPVPVIDQPVEKSPKSFAEMNNTGRDVALGLMGLIPEVGGGLKAMVGFFWAGNNNMADLWEQMKSYVDDRIRTYLDAAQLKNLRETLTGELKLLEQISRRTEKQGDDIFAMVDRIVTKEPHFQGQRKEVLPYLVGLGTLMISLRHKLYNMPDSEFSKTHDRVALKKDLEDSILEYTKAVEENRKEFLKLRMDLIPDRQDGRDDGGGYGSTLWSVARDHYDGWSMKWTLTTRGGYGDKDYQQLAEHAVQQRRNYIKLQYESELDEFLRLAKFWKYFKPNEPAYKDTLKERKIGAFGGYYSNTLFAPESKKKITKIITHVQGKGVLCGVEVFYDGTSSGMKGKAGVRSETMELTDGEYIANVFGYHSNSVGGVWFTTQKGKIAGGGSSAGTYFQASLADSFNAKLTGISGSYNGETIDNLSFHWEYMD